MTICMGTKPASDPIKDSARGGRRLKQGDRERERAGEVEVEGAVGDVKQRRNTNFRNFRKSGQLVDRVPTVYWLSKRKYREYRSESIVKRSLTP